MIMPRNPLHCFFFLMKIWETTLLVCLPADLKAILNAGWFLLGKKHHRNKRPAPIKGWVSCERAHPITFVFKLCSHALSSKLESSDFVSSGSSIRSHKGQLSAYVHCPVCLAHPEKGLNKNKCHCSHWLGFAFQISRASLTELGFWKCFLTVSHSHLTPT